MALSAPAAESRFNSRVAWTNGSQTELYIVSRGSFRARPSESDCARVVEPHKAIVQASGGESNCWIREGNNSSGAILSFSTRDRTIALCFSANLVKPKIAF